MPQASSVTTAVEFAVRSVSVQYDALARRRGTDALLEVVRCAEAFFQLSPECQRRAVEYISLLADQEARLAERTPPAQSATNACPGASAGTPSAA